MAKDNSGCTLTEMNTKNETEEVPLKLDGDILLDPVVEPEIEDCSDDTVPADAKKVLVPELVSMTKVLFERYRREMYFFLNKCLRDGTIEKLIGEKVCNRSINHEVCNFPRVSYWRIDRENFYADIVVELSLKTACGDRRWSGYLVCWCGFEELQLPEDPSSVVTRLFVEMQELREYTGRVGEGYVPLSSCLVPYASNREVDKIAEDLWRQYVPEALTDPKNRGAQLLAEKMRLHIMHLPVYEHNGIDSIVFFKAGELLVGEDRMVDVRGNQKKHVKAAQGEIKIIPAGTIVVNSNIRRWEHSSFNIFHECYHYDQHYLFYCLQELSSNDLRQVPVKEVCLEKDEVVKDSIYFMEKQANRGAMGLMMPVTHTRQLIRDEYVKVKEYRHAGDRYDVAGTNIRKRLELPDFRIRARMIQLGFVEAKGALNYIDGDKIEPFAFDPDAWRESDITYIINERLALKLAARNEALHELLESGKYVYADGHIVRNSPKFVRWVGLGRKRLLTDYANAHVDKCCLRFVQKYVQKTVGRYVYGRMYFDADYLKQTDFYLRDIINEQQVDEFDAMDMFIGSFPMDFKEAVNKLKKKNHISNAKLAEIFHMDDGTFGRILEDPRRYRNEDFLTVLCLCFKLPDWISSLLFKRARFQLDDSDRRHRAILHILRVQSNDGIDAANDYLKSHGMQPLSFNV